MLHHVVFLATTTKKKKSFSSRPTNACLILRFSHLKLDEMGPKELPVLKEEDDEDDEDNEEEMERIVVWAQDEKWDCETIISEFKSSLTHETNPRATEVELKCEQRSHV